MNSSLTLVNTVCLLFFTRKVLGSDLNKAAPGIWSHLKAVIGVSLRQSKRACKAQNKWGGGCFRSEMPHLICYKVMKCRYLPLKNMCPADMCEIYVYLPFFPTPFVKIHTQCNKRWFEIFSSPKEYSRRLSLQVKNVYANAGYIRACTGC